MHSVKLESRMTTVGPHTDVWIDGRKMEAVKAVTYEAAGNELHQVTVTFYAGEVEISSPCLPS